MHIVSMSAVGNAESLDCDDNHQLSRAHILLAHADRLSVQLPVHPSYPFRHCTHPLRLRRPINIRQIVHIASAYTHIGVFRIHAP